MTQSTPTRGRFAAVAAAGCLLALLPTAAHATDTVAPSLTGLRIAGPATVHVSSAPMSVGVTVHFTDSGGSGAKQVQVNATCETDCSGVTSTVTASGNVGTAFTAGTPAAGAVTVPLSVPQTAASGSWRVTGVVISDVAGNVTTVPDGSLSAYDGFRGFAVEKTADTTAPSLSSVSFPDGTVDTTLADADGAVDVHLTDAVSGVDHGDVVVTQVEDPTQTRLFSFSAADLHSGSGTDGTFRAMLPGTWSHLDAGHWTPTAVDAFDAFGNSAHLGSVPDAPTLTVHATGDGAGPAVAASPAPSFAPATVDTTTGSASTVMTLTLTDAVSGFAGASGSVSDGVPDHPSLPISIDADNRVSGDAKSGVYSVTLSVPARSPAGSYHVTALQLVDHYGNVTTVADFSGYPTLAVADADDTTAPALVSLAVGPAAPNVGPGAVPMSLYAHVTDDVSGVSEVEVHYSGPGESGTWTLAPTDRLPGGTVTDGTLRAAVPTLLSPGAHSIDSVDVVDLAGHIHTYAKAQLPAGSTSSFNVVVQAGDETGPSLDSLSFTPTTVDTTTGAGQSTLTLHATDLAASGVAPVGVAAIAVTLSPAAGADDPVVTDVDASDLSAGNVVAGTFSARVTVPRFALNGTWAVTDVTLTDAAGNPTDLYGAALTAALGSTPAISVSGPVDNIAPSLTSLNVPAGLDTTTGPATEIVRVAAADDVSAQPGDGVSGFCRATVVLTAPSETISASGSADAAKTNGTCPSTGTLSVPVTVPQFSESGVWTISVTLTDGVGHVRTLSPTDLSGQSQPSSVTVSAGTDGSPPDLVSLAFDPPSVDTTGGAVPVVVDAHLTDDVSGLSTATLSLANPAATSTVKTAFRRVGGTAGDGVYQASLTIPAYAPTGDWTVTHVHLTDAAGNSDDLTTSSLTDSGINPTLSVSGPTDAAPPQVTGISLTPSPLDVTAADGVETVALQLTDDTSGVSSVHADLVGPAPDNTRVSSATLFAPSTGSRLAGEWDLPVTIARFSSGGTWTLDNVVITDQAGNIATLTSADLAGTGPTSLTVTSTPDDTPPALTGFAFAAASVDVSGGDGQVQTTATITDDASGFSGGQFTLTSPDGQQVTGVFDPTPASGTGISGTFAGFATIPRYAEAGAWTVTSVILLDNVGHERDYPPDLPSSGTSLTVVDASADAAAPTVAGLAIAPGAIDVARGQLDLRLDAHLLDAGSGVSGGSITLTAPSGAPYTYDLTTYTAGGSGQDGHWTVDVPFGPDSELGTWTVSQISVTDVAANSQDYQSDQLPTPRTFLVSDQPQPLDAPAAPDVTSTSGAADLSWVPPMPNGDPATGWDVSVSPALPGGTTLIHVTGATPAAHVAGLAAATSYTFEVAADNAAGRGGYSPGRSMHGAKVAAGPAATLGWGKTLTVSTKVTDVATNSVVKGAVVHLLSRTGSGASWTLVTDVTASASTGVATTTVHPKANTQYEWTYAGVTDQRLAATSGIQKVTVVPIVAATLTRTSVRHGLAIRVYGSVTPVQPNAYVRLQRLVGRTWTTLAGKAKVVRQKLPDGRTRVGYILPFTPGAAGIYTLRVLRPATSTLGAGHSKTLVLRAT